MAAPFAEPMPTLLRHTQAHNVSASNINDKMPHSNRSPIVFIGDACHPMSPFSGVPRSVLTSCFPVRIPSPGVLPQLQLSS